MNKKNFKVIDSKLLACHNLNMNPEFWINHDIDNCNECQEALKI